MKLLSYWKVIVALTLVALCGGLIGAAVALRIQNQRLARQSGGGLASDASVKRLVNYLQLTAAQQEKIRPLLERSRGEIRALATNALARTVQVRQRLEAEVQPLLTPEQRQRLEKLTERRERLRERWQSGERLLPRLPEPRERRRERIQPRLKEPTNQMPATESNK